MPAVGRPPRVIYERVAEAADTLISAGERPTLRRLREVLGGGSIAALQRHLSQWKAERQRARAVTPLSIDPLDVANLSPADFVTLINHLIRAELREAGILALPDATLNVNCPDGGIDGVAVWSKGPERTRHLPSADVAWQSKSGRLPSPSDLKRELLRRQSEGIRLKPALADHFRRGGSYVLFSAADVPAIQHSARLRSLERTVSEALPGASPIFSIIGGAEIAAWANENLWARTFLIKSAGREHPAMLLTFEEWEQRPAFSNPYVHYAEGDKISASIRNRVSELEGAFRLDGAPGLGKTRLVLEALRPVSRVNDGVVYLDASYPGTEIELLRALANWRRFQVTGILVVDNCPLKLHQQIVQAAAGGHFVTITIGDRQESGADERVYRLADNVIGDIVRVHPLRPLQIGADTRVVAYAEGWPSVAVDVLQALRDGREAISELRDDELTSRLLGDIDAEERSVLQLLALFQHVGYRDQASEPQEWEILRDLFLSSVPRERFYAHVRRLERKQIIVSVGRYWMVTPSALAIRLARTWLEEAMPEVRERLFSALPPTLAEALARRFGEITTRTSVELARSLLEPDGRFGVLAGILGRTNATMFGALAEVCPEAAAAAVRRTLVPLSDVEASNINESNGRQTLVFALERLAFHGEHFYTAARGLFVLARAENATNGNNATGTLTKFFHVAGSQTEAAPEQKLAVIDEFLTADDLIANEIVAKLLTAIVRDDLPAWSTGPEDQGGRPPLVEWRAKLWSEVYDYCHEAVKRVLNLAKRGEHGQRLARSVCVSAIVSLVSFGQWDDLEELIGTLKGAAWPDAVEKLTWSLRHQLSGADDNARNRIQNLIGSLMPTTLAEKIELIITNPPYDIEDREGELIDHALERVETFAQDTILNGSVDEVLTVIASGNHRLPHAYSEFVARRSSNLEDLARRALDIYERAPEPRNDAALVGISIVITEAEPALRATLLCDVARNSRVSDALPALVAIPSATDEGALLLAEVCANNMCATQPRPNLFAGRAFRKTSAHAAMTLATALVDRGWYSSALELLLFGADKTARSDALIERIVLESHFVTKPLPDIHEWSVFREIRNMLEAGNTKFATALAREMIDLALSGAPFGQKLRVSGLWATLLEYDEVFQELKRAYSGLDKHGRWQLLISTQYVPEQQVGYRLALEAVPLDELVAFAAEYPDDLPWFLAQHGRLIDATNGALTITPLMDALLANFGDRENVLRCISANFHSFMTVGPRGPYYEKRIALVDSVPTYGKPRLGAWREHLRSELAAERQGAMMRDEEFNRGIF